MTELHVATGGGGGASLPFSRILVTGASGFVARSLGPALAARIETGGRIALAARNAFAPIPPGGERLTFDLGDAAAVDTGIDRFRPDLVVHLAAQSSVGRSREAAAATWSANLCGTLALAAAIGRRAPNCTVLFASSAEVYGLSFNDGVAGESTALRPLSAYARSKAAAETMLADVLPPSVRLIVARPTNHSGPGQATTFVIPGFAAQLTRAERGGATTIRVGNLEPRRDFLAVEDVVAAYLALVATAERLPPRATFNIASGTLVSIGDVLTRLRAASHVDTVVRAEPDRQRSTDVPCAAIDAAALRAATGWSPAVSLDAMLSAVLAFERNADRA